MSGAHAESFSCTRKTNAVKNEEQECRRQFDGAEKGRRRRRRWRRRVFDIREWWLLLAFLSFRFVFGFSARCASVIVCAQCTHASMTKMGNGRAKERRRKCPWVRLSLYKKILDISVPAWRCRRAHTNTIYYVLMRLHPPQVCPMSAIARLRKWNSRLRAHRTGSW